MSRYRKGIVASGHPQVSGAAAKILAAGGNAFDGVVAAGFAAAVVEPALTSLGGGGFLVGHSERLGRQLFFDFFVDTPGKGRRAPPEGLDFFPVIVHFSGSSQEFNIGLASVAVPGTLKGLVHTQQRLGRMPLAEVLEPARLLAAGHELNEQQARFISMLRPILMRTATGRRLYEPAGTVLQAGDRLANPACAALLEQIGSDYGEEFYRGELAASIDREMREGGGLLTRRDLAAYRVHERAPYRFCYGEHELVTAAEPSVGGALIGRSLDLLAGYEPVAGSWDDGRRLSRIAAVQLAVERLRADGVPAAASLPAVPAGRQRRLFSRGTTHISVADRFGNCAAMTCSNGEGSGYFAPGTGVMLNNMMGEDDLHPGGFHAEPPGHRVASMMAPSLLLHEGRVTLAIGSGGSKRIRTALFQVLSQLIDCRRNLADAVAAPRLHWDGAVLQIEPGFAETALAMVAEVAPIKVWDRQDVYFGGVHGVVPGRGGAGDPRRGGSVAEV